MKAFNEVHSDAAGAVNKILDVQEELVMGHPSLIASEKCRYV